MAGIVYLRTNRFEVKLEGITFRTKDFESLCAMDFLFPDGKVWARPPIVGLDVMRHPRDPSSLLVLLCFGVGCVILKFRAGEALPAPIHKFLADKRIHFVGFGIPEKKDLFPFEELGLTKNKVDIGYLAAKLLKDPKYKRWELAELARKVLGIKRMIGLTEATSFERHEQIKCAICQLFITSVIAMGLLGSNRDKKKLDNSPKKSSFLKNLNSLHLLAEGWFKMPRIMKKDRKVQQAEDGQESVRVHTGDAVEDDFLVKPKCIKGSFVNCFVNAKKIHDDDPYAFDPKMKEDSSSSEQDLVQVEITKGNLGDCDREGGKEASKRPLKGILKCSSTDLLRCNSFPSKVGSPPSTSKEQAAAGAGLKRANSKGFNVSFKCHEVNL